jgi:hypothetical protein
MTENIEDNPKKTKLKMDPLFIFTIIFLTVLPSIIATLWLRTVIKERKQKQNLQKRVLCLLKRLFLTLGNTGFGAIIQGYYFVISRMLIRLKLWKPNLVNMNNPF